VILDVLENHALYAAPGTRLRRAFEFLHHEWNPSLPDERIEVDGDLVFALPQSYPTRPLEQCRFESHRLYIDIQFVVSGAEGMGWAPVGALDVSEVHDPARDVAFYSLPARYATVPVHAGEFALFFPVDGHMPGLALPGIPGVRKVVMKIRV
jgi:YhcH/YjgK/YiaL family protein